MTSGFFNAELTSNSMINQKQYEGGFKPFAFLTKVFSVILLLLSGTSCETDLEVIKSFPEDEHMPSQSMVNAEIKYTDSARLQLRLTAPEIHNYSKSTEKYTEFSSGMLAEFFDKSGNIESQISSKYAIYNTDKGLWEARDSVKVINKEGEILNTEQLFWDEKEKIIYSNSFVKISRPNEVIMGEGFEADETFSRWRINRIQGTIYLEEDEQ